MTTRSGSTWLCDLGNSRAKLARLEDGRPADVATFDWNQPDFAGAVRGLITGWPRPRRILVASVASERLNGRLRGLLPDDPGVGIEWLRSPRTACGIRNRYVKPERLGIDRFLAMVAVHAHAARASIVVGCGTALTLDAIGADGTHAAGLIALSPGRMLEALHANTAIADGNPEAFGDGGEDDTAAALRAGCWAMAGATVAWFATRQRELLGEAKVWLHGGWAGPLAAWLENDGFHADLFEHAVLHGLALFCDHP